MKPTHHRLDRELDAATPQWPVVLASLADPPTVTVSGITTPMTGDDPQREVVAAWRPRRPGATAGPSGPG